MRCDLDKVPSVGLFGMVVHQGGLRAQKLFLKSLFLRRSWQKS